MTKDTRGLYNKYEILKDGQPVKEACFVLKPESDKTALEALRSYACNTHNVKLQRDLFEWIDEITMRAAEVIDDD